MSNRAAYRATSCAARASAAGEARQRGDEFEGCAARAGGQIVVADAMSEFKDEVVIRGEDSHRLYEFLFFVHFHANDYEEGGGTTAVPPYKYGMIRFVK